MNDGELDRLLQTLHTQEPPPGALAAVRARVQAKLAARRRMRFLFWLWAPAAVVVTALALFVLTPVFLPAPALRLVARVPAGPGVELLQPSSTPVVENRRGVAKSASRHPLGSRNRPTDAGKAPGRLREDTEKVLSARSEPASGERTEFVRMFTDDPNVVILWALNTKGE